MAKWPKTRAQEWYAKLPWLCGVNYVPSYAVNTVEFWQEQTFDAQTIGRELKIAADTGFNSVRVFVQYEVWANEVEGLISRLERFLSMAAGNGLSVMPVLFDDCAFNKGNPRMGKQDDPVPGRMMTSWTASPGHARVTDLSVWPRLEAYVKELIGSFRKDARIVLWDLYNEPGNEGMGEKSLPLLAECFKWARAAKPSQPVTSGLWRYDDAMKNLNAVKLKQSDVITFHTYSALADSENIISRLEQENRPVICTEWMSRWLNSRMETHLPMFRERGVGCYSWGLVNGRTQTQFGWDTLPKEARKNEWFHDLYYGDGRPYEPEEIELIRKVTGASGA